MSVLEEILQRKRDEVAERKSTVPLSELADRCKDAPRTRGFAQALWDAAAQVGVIAEVKKASPSKGVIREDFDHVAIARAYQAGGATALSVLTDEPFFKGCLSYLADIRQQVSLPLLRKDFTIDLYQVYESRVAGADAILLIVAALSDQELTDFRRAAEAIDLDCLVEAHTEDEMRRAIESGATILGVNNRDLHNFTIDLTTTERLARQKPQNALLVSESGIESRADVERVKRAGAGAVLVGESLMRENDIEKKLRELTCG